MDAPTSARATTELLKRLLEILDEEDAFDRTGGKPVLEFVYPEELQVSWSRLVRRMSHAILLTMVITDAVLMVIVVRTTKVYNFSERETAEKGFVWFLVKHK